MEQDAIYQQWNQVRQLDPDSVRDPNEPTVPGQGGRWDAWWASVGDGNPATLDSLRDFAATNFSALQCPSDTNEEPTLGPFVYTRQHGCTMSGGYFSIAGTPEARFWGKTNYLGNAGNLGDSDCGGYRIQRIGPFYGRSKTQFRDFLDGTSNTFMFGEVTGDYTYPAPGQRGVRQFSFHWTCGTMVGAWRLGGPEPEKWYKWASKHAGGSINYALGDGSVRTIQNTIDAGLFDNLCGMKDGVVAQLPN
jgi:hypothetical protein